MPIFGLVGSLLAAGGMVWYIYTIIYGDTRPNQITWGVWALIGALGASSAIQGGAGPGAWVAVVYLFFQIVVFGLTLSPKYNKKGREVYDYPLGLMAVVGILVWQIFDLPPSFAAAVAVTADATVGWFTLRESWRQPMTEPLRVWFIDSLAAALGLLAIAHWSFAASAYPVYLLVGNGAIFTTLLLARRYHRSTAATKKVRGGRGA